MKVLVAERVAVNGIVLDAVFDCDVVTRTAPRD